ncbi:MAG: hypothetical protein ACK5HL_03000 [Bacilli bacterium]
MENKQVLYIANIAKLNVNEENINNYKNKLEILIDELDKIIKLDMTSKKVFSTTDNLNKFNVLDIEKVDKKVLFKSIKNENEDYIETVKVLHD